MDQNYQNLSEADEVNLLATEIDNALSSMDAAYTAFSDALIAAVNILPKPRYAELERLYVRLHDVRKELESFPLEG